MKSYDWTVDIQGMTKTGIGVAAQGLDIALGGVSSHDFDMPGGNFSIPKGFTIRTVQLRFYDDVGGTNTRILKEWWELAANDRGVARIGDSGFSRVAVFKIGLCGGASFEASYLIVPNGELMFNGTQDAGLNIFTAMFNIVGDG